MFLANKLINFYNLLYGVDIYNPKQRFSKKESDIMLDFEENKRRLQDLKAKLQELGESL